MTMTSRERVLAAINHEEPDRIPIVIGANNATGLKMASYQKLKRWLGIQVGDAYLYDWPELGSAALDEVTMARLHTDVRGVLDRPPMATRERNRNREPHSPYFDTWGCGQTEIEPGVWFPTIHPLADAQTIEELENYPGWPDMDDPSRIAHVGEEIRSLAEENQYAVIATPWLLFPLE